MQPMLLSNCQVQVHTQRTMQWRCNMNEYLPKIKCIACPVLSQETWRHITKHFIVPTNGTSELTISCRAKRWAQEIFGGTSPSFTITQNYLPARPPRQSVYRSRHLSSNGPTESHEIQTDQSNQSETSCWDKFNIICLLLVTNKNLTLDFSASLQSTPSQ